MHRLIASFVQDRAAIPDAPRAIERIVIRRADIANLTADILSLEETGHHWKSLRSI